MDSQDGGTREAIGKGDRRMLTAIEDLLRLAWQAEDDGKPGMRDALLTLAVADSGAEDAVLAERCRRLLVARRPDHWFATSATLGQALAHSKVAAALARLRATFPPVRVRHLLLRGEALRGPYAGRPDPLARVVEDLTRSGRRRAGATAGAHALPFPGPVSAPERPAEPDSDAALVVLYFSVLLAMAVLIKSVIEPASRDTRAA
jgi:hypothetical protein